MLGSWLSKIKMMKAYVAGDLSSAIMHAKKCLDKNDKDTAALWTIADCLRLQGSNAEAIDYALRSYEADERHLDTLQLLTELYFEIEDYKQAYNYAYRAVSVAEELDLALHPYIEKMKQYFSSRVLQRPTQAFRRTIEGYEKETQDWIKWALQLMAWYESNHLPDKSDELH